MIPFYERMTSQLKEMERTRHWLSKKMKISYSTLTGWVKNGRLPRIDYAWDMAEILGVQLKYLLWGKND